jgi:hypothetical protein
MAFHAGDVSTALADEKMAVTLFPNFALAYTALARMALADGLPQMAYDAAARGASIVPLPETLGYQADAAMALHRPAEFARLRDEIFAIEKIGNAYRTNDRLLAMFYADHGLRPRDAVVIARRDVLVRGPEIYAQDTLAWSAARAGYWPEAERAIRLALRFHTQDSLLHYHAGFIAAHFGERAWEKRELALALRLNPHFHARFAPDARARLARL